MTNMETGASPERRVSAKTFALSCGILASMTSIVLGYDIGVVSGATLFIKEDLKLSDTQIEIVSGVLNLYALVGSFAAGRISDIIGRRFTIVIAAATFIAGAILMGLATDFAFLMVGRFVAGIGVGFAMMIAPVYTTEVAPAAYRGFLSSFPEVFINIGILLGYVSNFFLAKLSLNLGWRLMLGMGAFPAVLLGIGVLFMPESPRWLVLQGRIKDARHVLDRTSETKEESEQRLDEIKKAAGIPESCKDDKVDVPKKNHGKGVWKELFISPSPPVRRIFWTSLAIHFFQQASGIDSVVLYSPRIFEKAGIHDKNASLGATMAVGFVKTVFILVATFFLDKFGRRPLLLTSTGGMIISLLGLGVGLTVIDKHPNETVHWAVGLCVSTVLFFVAFFSIGQGPITWVYTSEIFPIRLRAQGVSIGVALNRTMSGIIGMTFISLYKAITIAGSFFLYMSIGIVAWIFFFVCLPETRGKSLEEIGMLFGLSPEETREVELPPESNGRGQASSSR
ncbi:Sugar transporter [Rhynchospora pubera]|uniref:Sugar transporter n=1 Tax=Rhynchospora pubera TaxID=906938 RepID=A0AAV8HH29_9POAL|nr:Sugar transporter [Rhynchospora pubera]